MYGSLPYVTYMPDGELNENTEFAFIAGVPFVSAHKHTEVVRRHIETIDRYREALRRISVDSGTSGVIARQALDSGSSLTDQQNGE